MVGKEHKFRTYEPSKHVHMQSKHKRKHLQLTASVLVCSTLTVCLFILELWLMKKEEEEERNQYFTSTSPILQLLQRLVRLWEYFYT